MKNTFEPSDFLTQGERVYHLDVPPSAFAPNILIAGDPGRVEEIGREFLSPIEHQSFHRGLRTVTGVCRETGQRVMVTTSGMGTPSLEIVLNELVALNEVDLAARRRKECWETVNIIRVGTSGALQEDTPLGTAIVTDFAVGLDNTGLFYEAGLADADCGELEEIVRQEVNGAMRAESRFRGKVFPYAARAHPDAVQALTAAAARLSCPAKTGITVSNSGFFSNQGRDVSRVERSVPEIDRLLGALSFHGQRIENMEMEASFLLHFMGGLKYRAGAICTTVAHRRRNTFDPHYAANVRAAVRVALHALRTLS